MKVPFLASVEVEGEGIVTADAAGSVSEWTDQSGAGNDFVQTTPANQPHI